MVNSDYNVLKDWMFGKLNYLLEDLVSNPNYPVLKMSLGEPTLKMLNLSDMNYLLILMSGVNIPLVQQS